MSDDAGATNDTRIEVDRRIAAEPAAIFDVLRSPDGHVAIDASGMLMSAEGEPAAAVGDRFVVHMDRDSLRDTIQPPIGHIYGYHLESIDGGTRVTSYYDWSDLHENYRELAKDVFPVISETNLRATLGILARTVAPGAPRPGAE